MSPVDQYIRRATTGLPGRTRLDTAAELRVHLNERIRQYMAQGFDRAEAEHLAVEQMGPAEPVNRSFLGHVFTPRVGWVVLALLVMAFGGWLAGNYLFAPNAKVEQRHVTFEEIVPFIGDFQMAQLTLPRGTHSLHGATIVGTGGLSQTSTALSRERENLRPNQRVTMSIGLGFLSTQFASGECEPGSKVLAEFWGEESRFWACTPVPSDNGRWAFLPQNDTTLVADRWQTLFLYRPSVEVEELAPGQRSFATMRGKHVVDADQDTWFALSVYASTSPMEGAGPPEPPTMADIVQEHGWLYF